MIPTDAGKELYTQVVGLIDRLEELSLEMRYVAGESTRPVLKFGGPTEFVTHEVIPMLPLDVAQYIADFGMVDQLIKRLADGELDFVIATKRMDEPGIQYVPIADETFLLVAPSDWTVPTDELKEWMDRQPWISYGLELPIIRRYYQTQFGERPDIRPEMVLPNVDAILTAVETKSGISVLPNYLIRHALERGTIQVVAPDRFATNVLYLAHRTESKHDPIINQVIRALKDEK